MKFATEQLVDAPCEAVFSALTDFSRFEREARDAGAEVHRTDNLTMPGTGMRWRARFEAKGRTREILAHLETMNHPGQLLYEGKMGGMEGDLGFVLTPLGANRTKLEAVLHLRARSITAKLMLQSLKLARSRVAKGFRQRVKSFCRQSEQQAMAA